MFRQRRVTGSFAKRILGGRHHVVSRSVATTTTTTRFAAVVQSSRHALLLGTCSLFGGKNAFGLDAVVRTKTTTGAATVAVDDYSLEDRIAKNQYQALRRKGIRNVAVIAHVDHGKTTLVDQLLRVSAASSSNSDGGTESYDRLLDSSDLEKERGITITSKVTRLRYNNDTIINCVDTPGHADFSAEVDRVLSLVDGVVLVCDAAEGPKSQTKYVLTRALRLGKQPLVVLNKCDRPDAMAMLDSGETESRLLDLFDSLGATDEQLNYRTLYASARNGWITEDPVVALDLAEQGYVADGSSNSESGMHLLLDAVLEEIDEPVVHSFAGAGATADSESREGSDFADDPLSLAAVTVGYDNYLGRTCTGRIVSGSVQVDDSVVIRKRDAAAAATDVKPTNITGVFVYKGISRIPLDQAAEDSTIAYAGDIVTLTGLDESLQVGDTVTSAKNPVPEALETPPLAPPTLAMEFSANNGPLAGREGTQIASSHIRQRLVQETDNNVTLQVAENRDEEGSEKTTLLARGELQLGILVETMRREGFEMILSPPRILTKTCPETGDTLEPFEEVTVDVNAEYSSAVVSALTGDRKGVLMESEVTGQEDDMSRLVFEAPSRGLLGFRSEIASLTKGNAVVNHLFLEDRPYAGMLGGGLTKGKLVSNDSGKATAYALTALSPRGILFVEPGDEVYSGMVIGENAKPGDMEVNPVRAKEKTNMRTHAKDEKVILPPPKRRPVEELIGYMEPDEVIEVTPHSVRLRKELLDSGARERAARTKAKQIRAQREK